MTILSKLQSPYWIRFTEYHAHNKPVEITDYTDLPVYEVVFQTRMRSELDAKMDIMDLIYKTLYKLDRPPKARKAIQIEIHNMIIPMMTRIVFGAKLFNEHKADIMKKYNFTETDIHPLLSAITPRRCGKTWCIAMFIVVMMICVPHIKIAILSRIIPQCVDMMNEARAFLSDYFPHIELKTDNKLTMSYKVSETDERWIRAYPSQADNVRGIGANLIICEEAAFMSEILMKKIIIPVLAMETTAIVCITTRSDEPYGFFETMINKTLDDIEGGTVFKQYSYDFVCDPCKALGIEAMESCKHGAAKRPSFQSERNHKLIRILLEDNKADLLRETMGIDPNDKPTLFRKDVVLRVFSLPKLQYHANLVDFIYVSIDPNSGTADAGPRNTSDFAMVSGFDSPESGFGCTGLESINAIEPEDYTQKMITHIRTLSCRFPTALIVIIAENNLGMMAGYMRRDIENFAALNTVFMNEKELKTGLNTNHRIKQDMMALTRRTLNGQKFFFTNDVINPELIPQLRQQMLNYMQKKKSSDTPIQSTKVYYTGKIDHGTKDDMCVALQLLLYWRDVFRTSDKYKHLRTRTAL